MFKFYYVEVKVYVEVRTVFTICRELEDCVFQLPASTRLSDVL